MRFTEAQRRHLELMLSRLVRETQERLEHWDETGVHDAGGEVLRLALRDVLAEAVRAADRLGIEIVEYPNDPRRTLGAWSSAWWSSVLNSRPSALRGYGEVDATTADAVAPVVDSLAARLLHLKAMTEADGGAG
ncbi:MAG: hypothetical protein PVH00_01180 [Gemmatimonadota bacterium]|jgi:hypothetical protein